MSRTEYDPTPHALAAFVKVALAVQAHAIQRARDVTQAPPEVRVARVEATRRAIYDGTLTLSRTGPGRATARGSACGAPSRLSAAFTTRTPRTRLAADLSRSNRPL